MDLDHAFHDAEMCKALLEKLDNRLNEYGKKIRFMEVCGTHTVSIFQSGLRSLLPKNLIHLSGPGCPVCVTHDSEIQAFLTLAKKEKVMLATFGDLMRVPSPDGSSLKHAQAQGSKIQIIYSPLDALELAKKNPDYNIVFLGVGFETTAPAVAAAIMSARKQNISNFSVFSCHKLVPPALKLLMEQVKENEQKEGESHSIDAFILPGHVALILGLEPFQFLATEYQKPSVVAGFEPAEIIHALHLLVEQKISQKSEVVNAYTRAVVDEGTPSARLMMEKVFSVCDTNWRGLGFIPQSGLAIREDFASFDARNVHAIELVETKKLAGCKCGEVLSGKINPMDCPLFGKVCTPQNPTGPCMVSTEGSCAAWYNYQSVII